MVAYPTNSGVINIKTDYNAKGDGTTDDSAAFQSALTRIANITNSSKPVLYIPGGNYIIKSPLFAKNSSGNYVSGLIIQGESKATVTLTVPDNSPLFNGSNGTGSAALISYGSDGTTGNRGFANTLSDVTIHTGSNNGIAVGVDFLGNNQASIRNVDIISTDYNGIAGISCLRYANGPALFDNVKVQGFNYGMTFAQPEYSTVLENCTLSNQKSSGINCDFHTLTIYNLNSSNAVPAINITDNGTVNLYNSSLTGVGTANQQSAINVTSNSHLYAENISKSLYPNIVAVQNGQTLTTDRLSVFSTFPLLLPNKFQDLPYTPTPAPPQYDFSHWKFIGATPGQYNDAFNAISTALNAGNEVVYFDSGQRYEIYSGMGFVIPPTVKYIVGLNASIAVPPSSYTYFNDAANPKPLFIVSDTGNTDTLYFEGIQFSTADAPAGLYFLQNKSNRKIVIARTIGAGIRNDAPASGSLGDMFFSDFSGAPIINTQQQRIWARQLNPEGNVTKVTNQKAKMWVLGFKTEGTKQIVNNSANGQIHILGGLTYAAGGSDQGVPAFDNNADNTQSQLLVNMTGTSYSDNQQFTTLVNDKLRGTTKTLLRSQVTNFGVGRFVFNYNSTNSMSTLILGLTTSGITIPNNTQSTVPFNQVYTDTDAQFGNSGLVCNKQGLYEFNTTVGLALNAAATRVSIQFVKTIASANNGGQGAVTQVWKGPAILNQPAGNFAITHVAPIPMLSGDSLIVQIRAEGTSGIILANPDNYNLYSTFGATLQSV